MSERSAEKLSAISKTQDQIAAMQGVTRCRISQIERRAMKKIRRAVAAYAAEAGVSPRDWLLGEGEEERSAEKRSAVSH